MHSGVQSIPSSGTQGWGHSRVPGTSESGTPRSGILDTQVPGIFRFLGSVHSAD